MVERSWIRGTEISAEQANIRLSLRAVATGFSVVVGAMGLASLVAAIVAPNDAGSVDDLQMDLARLLEENRRISIIDDCLSSS